VNGRGLGANISAQTKHLVGELYRERRRPLSDGGKDAQRNRRYAFGQGGDVRDGRWRRASERRALRAARAALVWLADVVVLLFFIL